MCKFKKETKKIVLLNFIYLIGLSFLISTDSAADSTHSKYNHFYFGRYTLDAPSNGKDLWSSFKIIEKKIELISKNGKYDLPIKISESIAKIDKLHSSGYAAYDRTVELEGGGAIIVSKSTSYTMEIYYLTPKNMLYRQTVDAISIKGIDKAITRAKELNKLIHYRNPTDAPPNGTFAIEAGYINLPIDKFQEQVSIGLTVSSAPGINLTFDTQLIGKPEPGLIARYEKRSTGTVLSTLQKTLSKSTLIRKSQRQVAGLKFEELLLKTNVEGQTVYSFRLEYPGTPNSSLEPYTVLELSTIDVTSGFKSDKEAVDFWDKLVESVKRI